MPFSARTSGRRSVDQWSIAPNPTDTTSTTTLPQGDTATSITGLNLFLLNTGSVARDHLASERTYLAYVRTSLALSMAGVGTSLLPVPVEWVRSTPDSLTTIQ